LSRSGTEGAADAKATGHRLTDKTLVTEIGSVIGIPEYMSPEQLI
jgi:hypothetical protein